MLEPKEITLKIAGYEKTFILHKFDCISGREIVANYIPTVLPKIGEYKLNEKLMLKLMGFVQVVTANGEKMRLETESLVKAHIPSWEMLVAVEKEMMVYNCSFFQNGSLLNFLKNFIPKLPQLISEILTDSSDSSSLPGEPLSGN